MAASLPPSANRTLPVRLYALLLTAASGAAAYAWARHVRAAPPVYIWMVFGVALAATHMQVAVSERDRWGPRVARAIPRRAWLRPAAFVFYSGAAGGVPFSSRPSV